MTKLCTLYRNVESFITIIFLPALFNYSECFSDVSFDWLSHSEFEAPSALASLLSSCSQSAALNKQPFNTLRTGDAGLRF